MKKSAAIILTAIILACFIFGGCKRISAENRVDISSAPDYSEEEFAAKMAEVKDVAFAVNGESDFSIFLVDKTLQNDAIFMQNILRRMFDNNDAFPILPHLVSPALILGNDGETIDGIVDDGYSITYSDGNIRLAGNNSGGSANAVYSFLEDDLGCMFVREDWEYVPELQTVYLNGLDRIDNPDFAWRRIYQYEVSQNDWSRRIKSNGTGEYIRFGKDAGNDGNAMWGTWCHSSFEFVPPEEYFDEHPEYFSYIAGKRRYQYCGMPAQLCFTNPDIYPIIKQKMAEFIAEYPECIYWDFSVNDSQTHCSCSECRKAKKQYGSNSGALLQLVNRLAEDFPDKIISTLAYYDYIDPPKRGIQLRDNVNIVLAPLHSSQMYSAKWGYMSSRKAHEQVQNWSEITNMIFLWDYTINFRHLLLPYPNYAVQKDNLEYYKDHNVKNIFHQGSREKDDEQARIRSYILAKQLWDTDVDVNALLKKYITVTYGKAAPYVAQYLDEMHASLYRSGMSLDLYDEPFFHAADYLSAGKLKKYSELMDSAEKVAENDRIKYYIEEFQINILYAKMTNGDLSYKERMNSFQRFKTLAISHGITRTGEVSPPIEDYFAAYPHDLKIEFSLAVLSFAIFVAALAFVAFVYSKRRKYAAENIILPPEKHERRSKK